MAWSDASLIFKYQNSLNSLALKASLVNCTLKDRFLEFHLIRFLFQFPISATFISEAFLLLLHVELFLCTGQVMNSHLPMGTMPVAGEAKTSKK